MTAARATSPGRPAPTRELLFAAFVAVASAVTTIAFGVHGPVDRITPAEAHALLDRGALLVDVRPPMAFELDHAEGAVNIPAEDVVFRYRELPRNRVLVVYCTVDDDCQRATGVLRAMGFEARELGAPGRGPTDPR